MNKKKVAFIFALPLRTSPILITMPFGLNIIQLLDKKDYEIDVFLSEYSNDSYQTLFSKNVSIHFIDQNYLWRNKVSLAFLLVTNFFKLKSIFKLRNKYDFIFGSGMAGITLGAILKKQNKKAKLVYLNDEFPNQGDLNLGKEIWTKNEIINAQIADIVATPDEYRFNALCNQIPNLSEKINFTLPNTPLIEELEDLPKINWHKEYNIPLEKKIFLMAGGISVHNYVIEIINSTQDWPENAVLLIKGKQNSLLSKRIKNKKNIFYDDNILSPDKLHSLIKYCTASICIYKEINDNFEFVGKSSGKLMRSIALGKPVITNNSVSFNFVKDLNLGKMISHPNEISNAIKFILKNNDELKEKCRRNYSRISYETYWSKFQKELFQRH